MANHTFTLPQEKIFPKVGEVWSGKFTTPAGPSKGRVSVGGHPAQRKYHAWLAADSAGLNKVPKSERTAMVVNIAIGTGSVTLAPATDYWFFVERSGAAGDDGGSVVEIRLKSST